MPHSSGGGSHSSGGSSHSSGGSSHSSSSYSSSSGGSYSSSSRSNIKTSKEYFSGSTRFVRYRNNKAEYIYANQDISRRFRLPQFLLSLIYIPFWVSGIFILVTSFSNPAKLKPYETQIIIEDELQILDKTDDLEKTLYNFRLKTGIVPGIITVENKTWLPYYNDLASYAYDRYVNMYEDEMHWLIVYSEDGNMVFNDWYFEGVMGYDTDPILYSKILDAFNEELNRSLTARTKYTVSQSFINAFEKIDSKLMRPRVSWEELGMGFFVLIFTLGHYTIMAYASNGSYRKYKGYIKCPVNGFEEKCDYCGGVYFTGTKTTCPHCGAPVKIKHKYG